MNKYLIFLPLAFLLGSCAKLDDAEYKTLETLVHKTPSVVEETGGTANVVVFTSGDVTVSTLNDFSSYASLNKNEFSGDDTLKVKFADNTGGHRRMAYILLSLNGTSKTDTLSVFQDGITDTLTCPAPFSLVNGAKDDEARFAVSTNFSMPNPVIEVKYKTGGQDWVKSARFVTPDTIAVITSRSNVESLSKAIVTLKYTDGWNNVMDLDFYITQSDKNGNFGTKVDFSSIASYAGKGVIADNVLVEGIVVSDCSSKNLDANPNKDYNVVDVNESDRTVYLESVDGSMGARIKFALPAFNVFKFGTKISISLQGISILKDSDSQSYTINDLTPDNIVESEVGHTPVQKIKTIASLSDEDLYTFVEIQNTEFVCKQGAFTNLYDNYSLKSSVNNYGASENKIFDGWATLLVDDTNRAIYAPINALCEWRRNQNGVPADVKAMISAGIIPEIGVPQGKGSVKGIIVHNVLRRYGDVGRYQIRVLDQDGFCQEWCGEPSYVTYAEWDGAPYQYRMDQGCYTTFNATRYPKATTAAGWYNSIIPSDDICASKTTPNAELTIENKTVCSFDTSYPLKRYWSHLALTGHGTSAKAGYLGRTSNGDINDKLPCSLQSRQEIKGWYKWQNDSIVGSNGYVIRTSTKDLNGSGMYVAYCFSIGRISAETSQYFPAHWHIEYSIDGGSTFTVCPDAATGKAYTHLHALPWHSANIGGIKYFTAAACGMGSTEHVAFLPDEVFGKDELIIRLCPHDDVMSIFPLIWDGDNENSHVYPNTTASVIMNIEYLYLRYRN